MIYFYEMWVKTNPMYLLLLQEQAVKTFGGEKRQCQTTYAKFEEPQGTLSAFKKPYVVLTFSGGWNFYIYFYNIYIRIQGSIS